MGVHATRMSDKGLQGHYLLPCRSISHDGWSVINCSVAAAYFQVIVLLLIVLNVQPVVLQFQLLQAWCALRKAILIHQPSTAPGVQIIPACLLACTGCHNGVILLVEEVYTYWNKLLTATTLAR